jgi:thioredoxin reductase (NADPH)
MFGTQLELDQWGYIKTDEDKRTNIDSVFAVGDVTSKKYRQITTATAIAITREIG